MYTDTICLKGTKRKVRPMTMLSGRMIDLLCSKATLLTRVLSGSDVPGSPSAQQRVRHRTLDTSLPVAQRGQTSLFSTLADTHSKPVSHWFLSTIIVNEVSSNYLLLNYRKVYFLQLYDNVYLLLSSSPLRLILFVPV